MTTARNTLGTTTREVSPAAAAGVSRILREAGIPQATEVRHRTFAEGYWAAPNGDHVRVEWDGAWGDEDEPERIAAGLARCEAALEGRGLEVLAVTREVAAPGGFRDGLVLEVRKPEWTRRDGHPGFTFPLLDPTGEGEPVIPPDGERLYWKDATWDYYVVYQFDRPACAFRCHYPGGGSPCDQATADAFIEWAETRR